MSGAPLFASDALEARVMQRHEVPELQALFDANPGYFQTINGRNALPDEAQTVFDERPPPHLAHGRNIVAAVRDRAGALVGVVIVDTDLCAVGVWHIALFQLAEALHGRGLAAPLHAALEAWARDGGARWLRLVVIEGNSRAERFWARLGYTALRRREGFDTGGRLNNARVMAKPLGPDGIDTYLSLVPRDQPGSTLP